MSTRACVSAVRPALPLVLWFSGRCLRAIAQCRALQDCRVCRLLADAVNESIMTVGQASPCPPAPHAAFAHRLATGREPVLTGTVAGALYAVGRLAGLLSLLSLAYAAVLAAFVVPKVRGAL